jgi:hypothetical protein
MALRAIETAFSLFIVLRDALLHAYPSLKASEDASSSFFLRICVQLPFEQGLKGVTGRSLAYATLRKSAPDR